MLEHLDSPLVPFRDYIFRPAGLPELPLLIFSFHQYKDASAACEEAAGAVFCTLDRDSCTATPVAAPRAFDAVKAEKALECI